MAGRDVVAEAVLLLELEDQASGEMAAAVAEFKAEAAALGREKAEIKLKADISEFKRKMAEARAELARLEAAEKREAARNAELSAQQKAASTRRLNGLRDERRAVEQNVKANDAELQSLQRKASVARSVNRMATQLTRERTAAEKASAAASRESAKATDDAAKSELRRAQALSRGLQLQEQYIRAQQRAEKASKAVSRAQGSDKIRVQLQSDRALADMERLRLELEAMGRKPIDMRVRVNRGDVGRARAALNRVGDAFGFTRTDQIKGAIGDLSRLTSWAKTARVNIGPLTTTIRGMAIGMATLGPVVTGVIGTLGALVSVVGAGVVGAAGVGAAALSGFGLATLGIASSVKPFLTSLQQAHTYTTALHTAVNKYGAGSKQAQKAQEQFNREMKTLPPLTRDTITGFEGLRKKWTGLTSAVAQKNIGNIIGSAFKTANADMGVFAKGTNQAFTAVTGGWQRWMAQLRSPGARQAIGNIMGNFAQSIPGIMGALGSLGAVFGRVISNFSNFLPHLSRGFAQWASGIKGASSASGGFANGVRHSVDAMRSLGHFAEAAGRVLINFFKAGIGPGAGLVNNMTTSLSHLADRMGTVAGQRRLTDFFSRSIGTTKQLFSAISPLISAFAQWGQAMAPVANVALQVVSAVAKVVAALAGFAPLKWTAGLLIGLSILGRLSAALRETAATAIGFGAKLGTALRGVAGGGGVASSFRQAFAKAAPGAGAGAELAAGVESGASAGAPILAAGVESGAAAAAAAIEGAGVGLGAEAASGIEGGGAAAGAEMAAAIEGAGAAAAAEMGTAAAGAGAAGAAGAAGLAAEAGGGAAALAGVEGAAAGAGTKVGILGRAFAALTSPVGLAGLAIGGFVLAAIALQSHSDTVAQSNKALADSFGQVRNAAHAARDVGTLPGIRNQAVTPMAALPGDRKRVNSLQAEYNKLTAQGATNTAHYRDVLNQLNQSILQQTNDQQAVQRASQQASQAHQADAKTIDGSLRGAYKDLNKAQAEDIKAQSEYKAGIISLKDRATAANNLARAHQNVNKILQQQRTVEFQLAADSLNAQRIAAGRVAATNAQSVAVGKLATEAKSLGGQAGQKALQFLIKTPNPADIAKISGQIDTLTPKDKTVALKILGDSKNAEDAIRRINALQVHEKVMRIIANMGDALFKINGLRGLSLPQKVQRVAANIGDTLIRIARVRGISLPAKIQRLLHSGDPETIGKILQIRGLGIPSKTLHILGDVARALAAHNQAEALSNIQRLFTMLGNPGPALSAWNAVNSTIHNISASVTLTATQIVNRIFRQSGSATPPPITQYVNRPKGGAAPAPSLGSPAQTFHHRAGGAAYAANGFMDNGLSTNTVMAKRQIQAEGEAQLHAVRQVRFGGVYDRPTIVVGEERKREYVIATNSAYRDQNVGFLAQAAGDFGYELVPLGTTRQNDPHTRRAGGVHMFAASGRRATAARRGPSISTLTQRAYPGAYTVPARDRIGGVGTDDIDSAVQRAQQRADAFHQKIYASGYKRRSSDKTADDRNYNILRQLQGLQASANNYIQIEKNLETDIQSVASYMSAASSSPDNAATGLNPVNGRIEHNAWATWKSIDVTLLARHRDMLQKAFNDARKHVKANASAHNLNYVKTLSAALGQSVVDLQAAQSQQPQVTELSFDDWLASIGYQRGQQQLLANVALAATNNVPDNPLTPGREDIASLSDDLAASQQLRDFYANMVGAAQAYRNPLTHQPDYPLITAAANAYTSARDDAQRISDQITGATSDTAAVQPPQVQLFDTARAQLYQQFGENTSSIGQSLASAASSAATVNQILNASVASPNKTPDIPPSMQKSVTVNNHFLSQPKDPHTWSQSVGWELQNAI